MNLKLWSIFLIEQHQPIPWILLYKVLKHASFSLFDSELCRWFELSDLTTLCGDGQLLMALGN